MSLLNKTEMNQDNKSTKILHTKTFLKRIPIINPKAKTTVKYHHRVNQSFKKETGNVE